MVRKARRNREEQAMRGALGRVANFSDCGHWLLTERPDAIADAVLAD